MRKVFTLSLYFTLLSFITTAFAQGECVLVIQGARDKADEDFFRNSADAFIAGMGAFPGMSQITVLRPQGESGQLGAEPPRTEQNYTDKEQLLKQIEEALCNENCKNVVIALIGHGMGGNGIRQPPADNKTGGMMISKGNKSENFLRAQDLAALIDKCKKSVKIVASHCYAEAMVNGIREHLHNKGLLGIGVASSRWNEESFGSGPSNAKMIYDFIKFFLQDYYLVINDPNVMEQLKKNAAELKKKNEEYNEQIKKENAEREQKIKDCEEELKALKEALDAINAEITAAREQKAAAEKIIDLLKQRITLEEKYEAEKDRQERKKIKDMLKENEAALKELGQKTIPKDRKLEKRIEKIEAEIAKREQEVKDLDQKIADLSKKWMEANGKVIDKGIELEDLKNTPPKVPIPTRDPLMELVIHEAFKSAKANTKSSHPQEPVKPAFTGNVDAPDTPPTKTKIGDRYFVYYKVEDKITGKCVVVGYEADAQGVPIQSISSKECKLDCSQIKFTYKDGGMEKEVEAIKEDDDYSYKVDGEEVSYLPNAQRQDLILPGQLADEVYYRVLFNTVPEVQVPGWNITQKAYTPQPPNLNFTMARGGEEHMVKMTFLPHGEALIAIDGQEAYPASATRRFTLLDEHNLPAGKIALIEQETQLLGTAVRCRDGQGIAVAGEFSTDLHRFLLSAADPSLEFQVSPLPGNPSLMSWQDGSAQGILQPDLQAEPSVEYVEILPSLTGQNILIWELMDGFMDESDLAQLLGTTITYRDEAGVEETVLIPPGQNSWQHQRSGSEGIIHYQLSATVQTNLYCAAYESPIFSEYSLPVCLVSESGPEPEARVSAEQASVPGVQVRVAPNPFTTTSTIHFQLPENTRVRWRIFAANGALIRQIDGDYTAGWNQIRIHSADFPQAGWYFFSLETRAGMYSGKLILMR